MFNIFKFFSRPQKPLELKKGLSFFGEDLENEILGSLCPICNKGALIRVVPSFEDELFRYSCGTKIQRVNNDLFFASEDEYLVLEDCI